MFRWKFIYIVGITIIVGLRAPYVLHADLGQETRSQNPFRSQLPPPPIEETRKEDKKGDESSKIQQPSPMVEDESLSGQQSVEEIINSLKVTGWVWNSKRPQAIINGQVLNIGDTLGETKIIAIRSNGIDVLNKNRVITITP